MTLSPGDRGQMVPRHCAEFTPRLQREGVRVPLSHCELVERGYGLPELDKVVPIEPVESNVVPLRKSRRKAAIAGQGALL